VLGVSKQKVSVLAVAMYLDTVVFGDEMLKRKAIQLLHFVPTPPPINYYANIYPQVSYLRISVFGVRFLFCAIEPRGCVTYDM